MLGFLLRTLVSALGLWLASAMLDGVSIDTTGTLIWAAILWGIVNALVRPLLVLLTLPITVITLGGFLLVINAGMFALVAWLLNNFHVAGFLPALFGAIIVSVVSWLANNFIGPRGSYEVLIVRRD